MPTAIHAGLSCRFEAPGVHLMDMDKPQAQLVQEFNDQQCDKLMLNVNQLWVSTIDYQHLSTGFQMASIVNNNDQRPTITSSTTTTTTTTRTTTPKTGKQGFLMIHDDSRAPRLENNNSSDGTSGFRVEICAAYVEVRLE